MFYAGLTAFLVGNFTLLFVFLFIVAIEFGVARVWQTIFPKEQPDICELPPLSERPLSQSALR